MDLDFSGVKDMVSNAAMLPIKVLGEDHATALKQYLRVTSQAWDIFQGVGGITSAVLIISNQ